MKKKAVKKLVLAKETLVRMEELKSAQGGFGEGYAFPSSNLWRACKC